MSNTIFTNQKRSYPPNGRQKQLLCELLNTNRKLLASKFSPSFTLKDAQREWTSIAQKLNSIPHGAVKSWQQWRKTWQDLKKQNIRKKSQIRKSQRDTGGGSPSHEVWEHIDEQVSDLISETLVSGNPEVVQPEVTFDFSVPSDFYNKHATPQMMPSYTDHDYSLIGSSTSTNIGPNVEPNIQTSGEQTSSAAKEMPHIKIKNRRPPTRVARLKYSQKISEELLKVTKSTAEENIKYKKSKLHLLEEHINLEKEKVLLLQQLLEVQKIFLRQLESNKENINVMQY